LLVNNYFWHDIFHKKILIHKRAQKYIINNMNKQG